MAKRYAKSGSGGKQRSKGYSKSERPWAHGSMTKELSSSKRGGRRM